MDGLHIIWDLEDDPDGNYWHIVVEGTASPSTKPKRFFANGTPTLLPVPAAASPLVLGGLPRASTSPLFSNMFSMIR